MYKKANELTCRKLINLCNLQRISSIHTAWKHSFIKYQKRKAKVKNKRYTAKPIVIKTNDACTHTLVFTHKIYTTTIK